MIALVKRLVLLILPLCAGFVAIIPYALPRTVWENPPYWQPFGFAACELPCWAGIRAGETHFDAAVDLVLENVPGRAGQILASGSQINFWAIHQDRALSGLIQYNGGRVGDVRMTVSVEIGLLIERIGVPSCVWLDDRVNTSGGSMVVYWEREAGSITALIPGVHAAYSLTSDTLTSGFSVNSQRAPCDDPTVIAWRGFAPAWRYLEWKHAQNSTQ